MDHADRSLLTPSVMDTSYEGRVQMMLGASSWSMLVIASVVLILARNQIQNWSWLVAACVLAIPIVSLVALRFEKFYLGSWCFTLGLWVLTTYSAMFSETVRVESFAILMFAMLLAFFLFDGGEWVVWLGLVTVTGVLAYFYEAGTGFVFSMGRSTTLFFEQITLVYITAVLFFVAKRSYTNALAHVAAISRRYESRSAELEEALFAQRQSDERFRHLAESSPDTLFIVNTDTLDIVDFNHNAVEMFGYSEQALHNMQLTDLLPAQQSSGEGTQIPHDKVERAMNGETVTFEWEHVAANGRIIPCQVYLVAFPFDGAPLIRASLHDITEQKRAQALLHQTDKINSLGLLAGGVAHDFNNLLVALLGQTSIALAKLDVSHPATRHVVKAVAAANRASGLTKQMLAFSGRGQLAVAPLDINELLKSNLDLFATTLPKQITIDSDLSASIQSVEGDRSQLQQVLMNLIINAGEAIGQQTGTISIQTKMLTISHKDREYWRLTCEALKPGPYVSITVRDTGSGMDAATVERIFDPFYTTKTNGTGLGLAAALGIVKGHGGGMVVYTEPGVGTEFRIVLPVVEPSPAFEGTVIVELPDMSFETGHILVVDDQHDVRETARDILEGYGHSVEMAVDGEDGVARFKETPADFDLVLLDISMPGINGDEAMALMRAVDQDVPVLLSSGFKRDGESLGISLVENHTHFLQKPYNQQDLLDAVGRIMR